MTISLALSLALSLSASPGGAVSAPPGSAPSAAAVPTPQQAPAPQVRAPPGATAAAFPYPVRRQALANGVRVLLVHHPSPRLAALFTFFRVGSRDEVDPGRSGFAHLFEHLAFRGTRDHPAEEWERAVKDLGLDANAFTDDDVSASWASGPAESLPALIALEADRFAHLAYDEDAFRQEARTVLGEYLRDAASPDFRLHEAVRALAFGRHPYQHTAMGLEADIRRMPAGYGYSQEFHRRFFRPENAVVLVVGDFDEAVVLSALERHFGAWRPAPAEPPLPPAPEPPQTAPRTERRSWPLAALPRHFTGWKTPGAADLDATAVQLVLWPYLFGPVSALWRDLVQERQLVDSLGGEYLPRRDPYLFGVSMVLRRPSAERPAQAAVEAAVAAVARGEVDERFLADVRQNLLSSLRMQTDTPYRTGLWLVYTTAAGGPDFLDEVFQRAARVEGRDLAAFARTQLVPPQRVTVTVAPGLPAPPTPGKAKP